jgi:hypothetical protein
MLTPKSYSVEDLTIFGRFLVNSAIKHASPNLSSITLYCTFVAFEAVLAVTMPGPVIKGKEEMRASFGSS